MIPKKYDKQFVDVLTKLQTVGWISKYSLNPNGSEYDVRWTKHGLEYAKKMILEKDSKLLGMKKDQIATTLLFVNKADPEFIRKNILKRLE